MLQKAGHIKNTVVLIIRHIQCLHLMYAEVVWELASSGTPVQLQIILDPDYLPDYLSASYDYDLEYQRCSGNQRNHPVNFSHLRSKSAW